MVSKLTNYVLKIRYQENNMKKVYDKNSERVKKSAALSERKKSEIMYRVLKLVKDLEHVTMKMREM